MVNRPPFRKGLKSGWNKPLPGFKLNREKKKGGLNRKRRMFKKGLLKYRMIEVKCVRE